MLFSFLLLPLGPRFPLLQDVADQPVQRCALRRRALDQRSAQRLVDPYACRVLLGQPVAREISCPAPIEGVSVRAGRRTSCGVGAGRGISSRPAVCIYRRYRWVSSGDQKEKPAFRRVLSWYFAAGIKLWAAQARREAVPEEQKCSAPERARPCLPCSQRACKPWNQPRPRPW